MAYGEALADRVRRAVGPRSDVTENKMFGGLAFLLGGKMFCGIVGHRLRSVVVPDNSLVVLQSDLRREPRISASSCTDRLEPQTPRGTSDGRLVYSEESRHTPCKLYRGTLSHSRIAAYTGGASRRSR